MSTAGRQLDGPLGAVVESRGPAGYRQSVNGHMSGRSLERGAGWGALRRAGDPLRRRPLTLCLRLAAGLEALAALHTRGGRNGPTSLSHLDRADTVRLATGAGLLAVAERPQLRVGALLMATLEQSLRTLALTLQPKTRRRNERLAVELAISATLGGLLHQAARAARWDR